MKISDARKAEISAIVQREGRLQFNQVTLTQAEIEHLGQVQSWIKDFKTRAEQYGSLTINQYIYLYEEMHGEKAQYIPNFDKYMEGEQDRLWDLVEHLYAGELTRKIEIIRRVLVLSIQSRDAKPDQLWIIAQDPETRVNYSIGVKAKNLGHELSLAKLWEFVGRDLFIRGHPTGGVYTVLPGWTKVYGFGRPSGGHAVHVAVTKMNLFIGPNSILTEQAFREARLKETNFMEVLQTRIGEVKQELKKYPEELAEVMQNPAYDNHFREHMQDLTKKREIHAQLVLTSLEDVEAAYRESGYFGKMKIQVSLKQALRHKKQMLLLTEKEKREAGLQAYVANFVKAELIKDERIIFECKDQLKDVPLPASFYLMPKIEE